MSYFGRTMSDSLSDAFIAACKEGDMAKVRELLANPKTYVHSYSEKAFREACYNGHYDVVVLLLRLRGRRAIWVNNYDWQGFDPSAFVGACKNGHLKIVQLLLSLTGDRRVHVHTEDELALQSACRNGHMEIIKLLLSLEGDRRIRVLSGYNSPLKSACIGGEIEVIRLLLSLTGDRKINIHADDEIAFSMACAFNQLEAVQFLLSLEGDQRIDVHAGRKISLSIDDEEEEYFPYYDECTINCLHSACKHDSLEVVQHLLSLTGDRKIDVNFDNDVAFRLACACNSANVTKYLLSLTGDQRIDVHVCEDAAFIYASGEEYVHEYNSVDVLLSAGFDRLPPKAVFDKHYVGKLTWEEVLWNNRPQAARLTSWRHSYEAHRDARLVYAQAKIGRPMELRRRLYLGKFAGGLDILGELDGRMVSPRDAAEIRGNTDCVAVVDEVAEEFTGMIRV